MLNDLCKDPYYSPRLCYNKTLGEGIWCALLPLIAGIFGIVASRDTKRSKICVMLVFSILGALTIAALVLIEAARLSHVWHHTLSRNFLELCLSKAAFGAIQFLLCTLSAILSCT